MAPQQHTALVTGASRGIGHAIADELGRQGVFVIGTATSDVGLQAIDTLLEDKNYQGRSLVLDIASQDSINALVKVLSDEGLVPTILVNNAAITRDNLLVRMKDDEWRQTIDTNLNATFYLCKAFVRGMMKARFGRIVNITSVVGLTGNPGQANYAASKAGAIGFTKSLAREVGSRGVTVNAIAPGFIDTDMTQALGQDQRDALLAQIPLGRLGDPRDVAAAVGFLVSSAAGYITGETLNVNGGMYMP